MIGNLSRKVRRAALPRPPSVEVELPGGVLIVPVEVADDVRAAAAALERADRTPRVAMIDGDTGEHRAPRIRLDGPTLKVRRRRLIGPRAGGLLPGWRWSVWDGCALFAHGEAASWAAAHARGGAALDQAVARARGRVEAVGV